MSCIEAKPANHSWQPAREGRCRTGLTAEAHHGLAAALVDGQHMNADGI
jgi:hypothetical protein